MSVFRFPTISGRVLLVAVAFGFLPTGCSTFGVKREREVLTVESDVSSEGWSLRPSWMGLDNATKERLRETFVRTPDGRWNSDPSSGTYVHPALESFAQAEDDFRREEYAKALPVFKRLAMRYKETPLEEDALFYQAECEYHLSRLPKAQDTYSKLLTRYPTTRHLPAAVQRTYDISYFWLEDARRRSQGEPSQYPFWSRYVNFSDPRRPLMFTESHAVEAIETIQQHDPLGPLTDDAVFMAAGEKLRSGEDIIAAGYYEQIAIDQPRSDLATKSLMFGAQSYLRCYEGPEYDGENLEHSLRLTKAALGRGDSLSSEEREKLEQNLRIIEIELAKRQFSTADYYRRKGNRNAARYCYQIVVNKYPTTDWAQRAQEEMVKLDTMPEPFDLFGWMGNRLRRQPRADIEPPAGSIPTSTESEASINAMDSLRSTPR